MELPFEGEVARELAGVLQAAGATASTAVIKDDGYRDRPYYLDSVAGIAARLAAATVIDPRKVDHLEGAVPDPWPGRATLEVGRANPPDFITFFAPR